MSTPPKVSVLILSWNGKQHLEVCLPALQAQLDPGVPWEVLVLDNGSHDGTAEWVARHHPAVRLLQSPVNLGFCAGNNRLVEAADGDWVAFLNNDTRPQPQWLAALVATLAGAPADIAAVSGQIVDWEGERLDFAQGVLTFDGHAFQKGFGWPLATAPVPTAGSELLFACGGNMLIRRSAFLAVGGFDPAYFAYLEDVDLGWRLWSAGQRILFAPDALVHHRSMATSEHLGHFNRGFLFERNAFLTVYKNYEPGLWEKMMPAVQLTLTHRTQTLLVQNNPAGEQLTFDPYAGLIANTASPSPAAAPDPIPAPAASTPATPTTPPPAGLLGKWRQYGPREFWRRGWRKAVRRVAEPWLEQTPAHVPQLTDGRTVAQLRALTYLISHLDQAAVARRAIQSRRQRSDREIFARFPLYIVPTYPGDERLFNSPGFADWLPQDVPWVRAELQELMRFRG